MKKKVAHTLLIAMLAVMLVAPASQGHALGKSGTITEELPLALLPNLTLHAEGVLVEFHETEDAPYAELDATVLGINSADVEYAMTVTEAENGLIIDATHTGKDIGLNRVKLNIYLPENILDNLAIDLHDSDMALKDTRVQILSGSMENSKMTGDDDIITLDVDVTDSNINIDGLVGGIDLQCANSDIKIHTSEMPAGLTITGTDTDVTLKLPADDEGFALAYSVTDGELSTNFADDYDKHSGTITHGDGLQAFSITLDHAHLSIHKY